MVDNLGGKTKLGLKAVVFMIMTSCLGIRWITVAGGLGPSAIFFWVIAALLFFVPLALIVIELSLNYKDNGGVYLWVKEGIGNKSGFYTAWFYWINNVFYYPGLLTFIAVNLAYLIGDHSLATNPHFVVMVVIIFFWGAVFFNIAGIHLIAKITTLSGLMNFRLGLFVIIAGVYYVLYHGDSVTHYHWKAFLPQKDLFHSLSSVTMLMLALAGVEMIPTMSRSIDNPEKNLIKAIIIGGALLVALYIIGTITINFIMTPKELSKTSGLVESLYAIVAKLHWPEWMAKFIVISLVIVEFGGLNIWLITSSIMFFQCAEKGILPVWLQKVNVNYVPANALIAQGVLVTVIVLLTQFMPSVNAMYTVLVLMSTIIYFLPFLFLSVAYIRIRKMRNLERQILSDKMAKLMAILTFISILTAMCLAVIPTEDLTTKFQIFIYELELIGGPIVFIIMAVLLYKRKERNLTRQRVL